MNNLEVLKSGIEGFGLEASDKKLQNLKPNICFQMN